MNDSEIIESFKRDINALDVAIKVVEREIVVQREIAAYAASGGKIDETLYVSTLESLGKLRLNLLSELNTFRLGITARSSRL